MTKEQLKEKIFDAFSKTNFPGEAFLVNSIQGDEPYLLKEEFKDKTDWKSLEAGFLDAAPDGYSTALSFFSDEALMFYLPAFLIADIDEKLASTDVVFYLTHGFTYNSRHGIINQQRYGARTWWDYATFRFSTFSKEMAQAVVTYLEFKTIQDNYNANNIAEALNNYWYERIDQT